ncbi:MAG: hypothetical protein PHS42_08405 [Sulfurimonas sp.]|nr:hypothetical protein [Sulfurimonas sp.]MDD3835482.1 hypothetical protein [Sulfurimonas sp.]
MKKLTNIQSTIITRMLEEEIFKTYIFVNEENKKGKSRGWIWENIYELEELGLIQRITENTRKIIHKKNFDKNLLKEKDIKFLYEAEITTEFKKNNITIKDLEKAIKDLKN